MTATAISEFDPIARELGLRVEQVQSVTALLDEGNTVPFITRYRKDRTGGLDEEQIRSVESLVGKARLLEQRKHTILRTIDAQGKLTPELAAEINAADSVRRLEDLYLPYKPRKQTLATAARERGLEPLANEILTAAESCADLDARAADFVDADRGVGAPADALLGAGHILAERFSERADLRGRLRAIVHGGGSLVCSQIGGDKGDEVAQDEKPPGGEQAAAARGTAPTESISQQVPESAGDTPSPESQPPETESTDATVPVANEPDAQEPATVEATTDSPGAVQPEATQSDDAKPETPPSTAPEPKPASSRKTTKQSAKKKKKKEASAAFRDFFQFSQPLNKVPHHRVLAINRGERAKAIRVKVEADVEALHQALDEVLVPEGHPHADFLRGCARDALSRLIMPSLEREFRREMTEAAEFHAVDVFARNLRKLLLQPPIRGRRVLAIDPGFKSGCKLVALDEFGTPLENAVIHVTGKDEARRDAAKEKLAELMQTHNCRVVAIGNGTACRETEAVVAAMIAEKLADEEAAYVIVNEAGASVYSTSAVGREEFPDLDATVRGSVSIGRRLQDPLSELVKIEPANIGVGMYQHDVKAKHLQASLDSVIESCVNFVGVELNTASVSLLRHVSGLNHLIARRIVEHRGKNGPFQRREQLKSVAGVGEATFVQAAGFLRIPDGEDPLDGTWIHPESYDAACRVVERLGFTPGQLAENQTREQMAAKTAEINAAELTGELDVGELLLKDILSQLSRPGRDPREDLPPPVFKREILKFEDLKTGMELTGSVLNVVDFGAFIDIGVKDSGLVHISQLANGYVKDPHDVVSVGDVVKVWVKEVDGERRRVALTMIEPGTEQPPPPPRRKPQREASGKERGKERQGQRRRRDRGKRKDEGREAAKHRPRRPRPAPPPAKLTEAKKKGQEPLQTFGELMAFYKEEKEQAEEPDGEQDKSDS